MTSQEEVEDISKKDEEEEKMRKFLTEAEMYENGLTYIQMKELVGILKESKEMHEKRNSQCFQPPDSPVKNTTDNNNETPKKYNTNTQKNSSNVNTDKENTEKAAESISKCGSNENFRPKKNSLDFLKKDLRKKKYTMDPLQVVIPEDDMALSKPIIEDSKSPDYCSDSNIPIKERVEEFSKFLQQFRDAWIMENSDVVADSELEWGSPIEVDNRMFSSDKKVMTRQIEPEPTRETPSRASKRKANTLIANLNNISDSEPEADDDDDDSALLKKRKPQQERRNPDTDGSNMQMDIDIEAVPDTQTPSTSYSSFHTANETKIDDSDNEDIFEFKIKQSSEAVYPRKIQPPIPGMNKARRGKPRSGKTNYKGPRAKKTNENTNKTTTIDEGEKTVLANQKESPPEIILDCETSELLDISPQTNMKMLKMPLAEKQRMSKQKLKDIENMENAKIEEAKLSEQKIEEEVKKKQEELVKKRLAELEESQKLSKEREERDKSMQKKWNNVLHEKSKIKEKIKDNKNLSADEIRQELNTEDEIVICDDLRSGQSSSSSKKVNEVACPICNRLFPEIEIENHASGCNLFEVEETSSPIIGKRQRKNNMDKHFCHNCKNFDTTDAVTYMEHVQICTEEHGRKRNSDSSANQGDIQGNYTPERKNFNLRRRP